MKGFPKHIATKQDIKHLMAYLSTPHATAENKAQGIDFLNSLLNTRNYVFNRVLGESEGPDGPEPEYKVLDGQGEAGDEKHQFVLVEDPNARLHKLDLTAVEVQDWINQIEEAR